MLTEVGLRMQTAKESLLNPFVVGGALRNSDGYGFFGRSDVFNFVQSHLNSVQRTAIILYGHRRIGKSSILRQINHKLSSEFSCIYYDLQGSGKSSLDTVLYGLGRAIADKLGITRPERVETTEENFEPQFLRRVADQFGDTRRLVLLLDEFDAIDDRKTDAAVAAKRFIPFLRRLVESGLNLGLVLVLGRRTSELSEEFNFSLLKDSVQMRIGRLSAAQTAEMIQTLAAPGLHFSPEAIDRVIELAAGHPYCSQVLCYAIWERCAHRRTEISMQEVNAAVPDTIELGANGMTWIYDGLELPEQRLFLSSLSEIADPLAAQRSSLNAIQSFLRDHQLSLGQADLDSAARDLSAWDVITESEIGGYRFIVPLLGAWVRRERPVLQLQQEVRFANPRAWSFYELALESEQRGDLDAAIVDYRNALQANPVFLEAQRRLATVFQKRGSPGDLLAAIEAWERVLEIDPAAPRAELLDALLLALEKTQNGARITSLFQKITNLDTTSGVTRERAVRNVVERAAAKMAIGGKIAIARAIELYTLVGEQVEARRASELLRKLSRFENIAPLVFLVSVALATVWGFIPGLPQLGDVRLLLCSLAGISATWEACIQKDPTVTLKKLGLLFLILGLIAGEFVWRLTDSLGWGGVVSLFVAVSNSATAPTLPTDSDEDLLLAKEPGGGSLFRWAGRVVTLATRIRDGLATSSAEQKGRKT
jgi:tetratricopeptide (TPR) repeat protein